MIARYILFLAKYSNSFLLIFFAFNLCLCVAYSIHYLLNSNFLLLLLIQPFLFVSMMSCYTLLKFKVISYNTKIEKVKQFLKKNTVSDDVIFFSFISNNLEENYCELVVTKGSKAEELLEATHIEFVKKWKTK